VACFHVFILGSSRWVGRITSADTLPPGRRARPQRMASNEAEGTSERALNMGSQDGYGLPGNPQIR
jgi:hypothetical protein